MVVVILSQWYTDFDEPCVILLGNQIAEIKVLSRIAAFYS